MSHRKNNRGLQVIGFLKLLKGALLITAGIGMAALFHKDLESTFKHWAQLLNLDAHHQLLHRFLEKFLRLSPRLPLLSAATFIYGALFVTEGVGLLLAKPWAEYLTVIVTGSFLPIEGYEMARHPSVAKSITIVVNLAILIYLIVRLRKTQESPHRKVSKPRRHSKSTA